MKEKDYYIFSIKGSNPLKLQINKENKTIRFVMEDSEQCVQLSTWHEFESLEKDFETLLKIFKSK